MSKVNHVACHVSQRIVFRDDSAVTASLDFDQDRANHLIPAMAVWLVVRTAARPCDRREMVTLVNASIPLAPHGRARHDTGNASFSLTRAARTEFTSVPRRSISASTTSPGWR